MKSGPETLEWMRSIGMDINAEKMINDLVNELLASLFIPIQSEEYGLLFRRDPIRCDHFGIEDEPINWGDLKCAEVRAFDDGRFLVIIDEASPGACPTLCDYIGRHLKIRGWDCDVETEW